MVLEGLKLILFVICVHSDVHYLCPFICFYFCCHLNVSVCHSVKAFEVLSYCA